MGIEGHWVGSYFQEFYPDPQNLRAKNLRNHFPIEAWFEVDGFDVKGRMVDLNAERTVPYADFINCRSMGMNWLERWFARKFAAKYPDCVYRMRLGEDSSLLGRVEGSKVIFTKTYVGPIEHVYCFGEKEQVQHVENPPIEYVGELSSDGNSITGAYRFKSAPHQPQDPRAIQTFELRRQQIDCFTRTLVSQTARPLQNRD